MDCASDALGSDIKGAPVHYQQTFREAVKDGGGEVGEVTVVAHVLKGDGNQSHHQSRRRRGGEGGGGGTSEFIAPSESVETIMKRSVGEAGGAQVPYRQILRDVRGKGRGAGVHYGQRVREGGEGRGGTGVPVRYRQRVREGRGGGEVTGVPVRHRQMDSEGGGAAAACIAALAALLTLGGFPHASLALSQVGRSPLPFEP